MMIYRQKLVTVLAALVVFLTVSGGSVFAQFVQGPNGHLYQAVTDPFISWDAAAAATELFDVCGRSAHLATITSLEEDMFVELIRAEAVAAANIPSEFWVGGFQPPGSPEPDGGWTWVNGEGSIPAPGVGPGYEHWLPGEPNNVAGIERHLGIGIFGQFGWNDEGFVQLIGGYIVEVDVEATVMIGDCDTGVPNLLMDPQTGCTISDLIRLCAESAENHGDFVSCVAQLTNGLKKAGIISGAEKGRIQSCAARSDLP